MPGMTTLIWIEFGPLCWQASSLRDQLKVGQLDVDWFSRARGPRDWVAYRLRALACSRRGDAKARMVGAICLGWIIRARSVEVRDEALGVIPGTEVGKGSM